MSNTQNTTTTHTAFEDTRHPHTFTTNTEGPTTFARPYHACTNAHNWHIKGCTNNGASSCSPITAEAVKVRRFKNRPNEMKVDWFGPIGGSMTWVPASFKVRTQDGREFGGE